MWLTSLPNTRDLFIYDIATSKELAVNLECIQSVTEADSFSWFFLQSNSNLFTSSTKKEPPCCSSLLMESQFSYFPCCWDLVKKKVHGRKGCRHVRRGDLWEKRFILVGSLRRSSYPSQQGIAAGREGVVTKGALAGHKQKSGQDRKPQVCGFFTVIPQPS